MASPCNYADEENCRNNLSHFPVLGQNIKCIHMYLQADSYAMQISNKTTSFRFIDSGRHSRLVIPSLCSYFILFSCSLTLARAPCFSIGDASVPGSKDSPQWSLGALKHIEALHLLQFAACVTGV